MAVYVAPTYGSPAHILHTPHVPGEIAHWGSQLILRREIVPVNDRSPFGAGFASMLCSVLQ